MLKKGRDIYAERKRIFMTDDSYIMKNSSGGNSLITHEDLNKVTCLKKEQINLERKAEQKQDYLMRLLKSELIREKKIQKVQDRIKKKEKQLAKFLKNKTENLKFIENERYQDIQDVQERQKLYDKIMSNYNKKIDITRKNNSQNEEKMLELKEKIKDFEKKNKEYKAKITEMFDLKENDNKNKKQNEDDKSDDKKDDNKNDKKEFVKKVDISSPNLGRNKYLDMEEKFEIERYKRENVLMNRMNIYQNKIDKYLEKNEEKEKKIKKAMEKLEKKRNEKTMMKNIHFDEVRDNINKKQKRYESERKKKIKNLEEKDLKDFAIKQEKIKLYEERKKINQMNSEEREALKSKFLEILKENKKKLSKIDDKDNETFINKLIYS